MRIAFVLLAACGRIGFDDVATSVVDGPPVDCWPQWRAGTPSFASMGPITELANAENHGNPWLTYDGKSLFFDRGIGDTEIFHADRSAVGQPFGPPERLEAFSSEDEDTGIVLSRDLKIAVFASTRTGSQGFDLWQASRATATSTWSAPRQNPLIQINDGMNQFDAFLTGDSRRLYYSSSVAGGQALFFAARTTDVFPPPVPLAGAGAFAVEADPDLSPDELVLVFSAQNPLKLYAAVRPSTTAPFNPPFALTMLWGGGYDGDPAFSPDGCELFFVSDRGGNRNLYRATLSP